MHDVIFNSDFIGLLIWVLLFAVSTATAALVIRCAWILRRGRFGSAAELMTLLKAGDWENAYTHCEANPSIVNRIAGAMLQVAHGKTKAERQELAVAATPDPGSDWPTDYPKWKVNGTSVQSGGGTYAFSAASRESGKYTVSVECGNEVAINVYAVRSSFMMAVATPTGTSAPISFLWTNTIPSVIYDVDVGHVAWQLHISPEAAKNVIPFKGDASFLRTYIGFHANSSAVAFSGEALAPTPSFHMPDSITGTAETYRITISNLLAGLAHTKTVVASPGDYRLGTVCYATKGAVVLIDWTHTSTRNCASTALEAGRSCGLSMRSGFGSWRGSFAGLNVVFGGIGPAFL